MTERLVPTILTARLKLRAHVAADFDVLADHWRHPDVIRFTGGNERSLQDVWTNNIMRNRGLWQVLGYGYWLVEDRRTGEFVGEVGFADFHRDSEPRFWNVPESGWVIAPAHFGKGFASEAVKAMHEWFDEVCDAEKSVCIIDDENAASKRIAAKIGYMQKGTVLYRGEEVCFFERTRRS